MLQYDKNKTFTRSPPFQFFIKNLCSFVDTDPSINKNEYLLTLTYLNMLLATNHTASEWGKFCYLITHSVSKKN